MSSHRPLVRSAARSDGPSGVIGLGKASTLSTEPRQALSPIPKHGSYSQVGERRL